MYKCMDFLPSAFYNPAIYGGPGMRLGQHLSPSVGAPFLSPPPETQTVREGGGREGERGREVEGREGGGESEMAVVH